MTEQYPIKIPEKIQLHNFVLEYPPGVTPGKKIHEYPSWVITDTDTHVPTKANIVLPDGRFFKVTFREGHIYRIDYTNCHGQITFDHKPVRSFEGIITFEGENIMHMEQMKTIFTDGTETVDAISPPPPVLMNAHFTEYISA